MTNLYVYQGLPPSRSIRLFRLFPSANAEKPLRGELFEYSLQEMYEQEQPYDALSYVWGQSNTTHSIEVNGCDLRITASLQTALSYMRHRRREKLIWVDALCINQDDDAEKEHQIGLMHQIYGCSNCVIVWLGETKDESDEALEDLRMIGAQWHRFSKQEEEVSDRIVRLLQRPWFRRIWVLQEVGAARRVLIRCGHCEMDGYAFGIAASLLKLEEAQEGWQPLQNTVRSIAYLMQGSVFRAPYKALSAASEGICSFGELVDMFHDREALKAQDKVFALLGMSSTDMESSGLLPDYTLSLQQLLERLVRFVISKDLPVECHKEKEIAVLEARGYVLGQVISTADDNRFNGMQRIEIGWRYDIWRNGKFFISSRKDLHIEFMLLRTSRIPVQRGDIICLLDGASSPTIIRTYPDFSVVVVAVASLSADDRSTETKSRVSFLRAVGIQTRQNRADDKSTDTTKSPMDYRVERFTERHFILIWDWHYSFESYSHLGGYLDWAQENDWVVPDLAVLNVDRLRGLPFRHYETALLHLDGCGLRASEYYFNETLKMFEESSRSAELYPTVKEVFSAFLKDVRDAWSLEELRPDPELRLGPYCYAVSTLFCWALKKSRINLIEFLAETGDVDPDFKQPYITRDEYREPMLSLASRLGSENSVKWLLQMNADVNATHREHRNDTITALMVAAEAGHIGIVEMLLAAGADASLPSCHYDYGHHTALTLAAKAGQVAVVERLLHVETIPNPSFAQATTALITGAEAGQLHIVERLIQLGADVSEVGWSYGTYKGAAHQVTTPLGMAARNGHLLVLERLLEAGADVNVTYSDSDSDLAPWIPRHKKWDEKNIRSALSLALEGGHQNIAERLKAVGAMRTKWEEAIEAEESAEARKTTDDLSSGADARSEVSSDLKGS